MEAVPKTTPVYSIGKVARRLRISVQTLRLYESKGLIIAVKSKGNRRLYSESDIQRLECIRAAITEKKIGIEGTRHIHAMIPCWQIKGCPMRERVVCPAYLGHHAGCWSLAHSDNVCAGEDCRSCAVYQLSGDCEEIKKSIVIATDKYPDAKTVLMVRNDQP